MQFDLVPAGQAGRERDRVHAGAGRAAPEPRRRRAARACAQSRSQRCCNCRAAASRNASTWARADASHVSVAARSGPRPRESRSQLVVVEDGLYRACERADVTRREQEAGVADDLGERGIIGRDDRRASRERFQCREAESFVARRDDARGRAPVQRVDGAPRHRAEHTHARLIQAGDLTPPRWTDDEQLQIRSGRAQASQRGDDRGQILAGLDCSDRQEVRVSHAEICERRVDLVVVSLDGRVHAERRDDDALGLEALADELDAGERRRCEHERGLVPRAISRPRRWKLAPRLVVFSGTRRNAMSWIVTASGVPRTGGTARLGACTTSASMRTTGRRARLQSS